MIKTETLAEFKLKFPASLDASTRDNSRLPYTPWRDIELLLHLAMNAPEGPMLEIGTHRGHTAAMLASEFPDRQVVTCDPGDKVGVDLRLAVQRAEYLPQGSIGEECRGLKNVEVIKSAFPGIDFGDRRFAAIFIDGDHHAEAVRADTEKALGHPLLAEGGVVVWHDVGNSHVPQVREVLESLDIEVTHVDGTWIAYAIDYGGRPANVAAQPLAKQDEADTVLESPFEQAANIESECGL